MLDFNLIKENPKIKPLCIDIYPYELEKLS